MSAGTKKVVNIEGHRTKADLKARAEADKAAERKNSLALEPPVWIKDMPEVQAIWDDLVRKMEGIELLDGLDADMLAEAKAAFLKMRDAGRGDAQAAALAMLAGGHRLAESLLGLPLGRLVTGAPADLVVFDYRSPVPLTSENLAGHLLFGIDRSHVRSTIVAGRFVLRDRALATVNEAEVFTRARAAAGALWERMRQLPA